MLLQVELDKLFNDIESRIICKEDTANYLRNLKPPKYEIETLGWRYRLLGFLDALVATKKMNLKHYEGFFLVLFGLETNEERRTSVAIQHYAIRVITENGHNDFDIVAANHNDAYYQLSKRIDYRALLKNIIAIEVYKGLSKHIEEITNQLIYRFENDQLFTQVAIENSKHHLVQ